MTSDPRRINRDGMDPSGVAPDPTQYPERVLQIGEGRFLRGFADWLIQQLNQREVFQGGVVVIAPRASGGENIRKLRAQDGRFTVKLQGLDEGRIVDRDEVITVISRALDPVSEWRTVLSTAENAEMALIISNTTEAGIEYRREVFETGRCPTSFPAKLAAYLYHRYQYFSGDPTRGMTVLPTELVEKNGDQLRAIVRHHAQDWELPISFIDWLMTANRFCNTLVDRIVTGYPEGTDAQTLSQRLGYLDAFYTVAEPFYLWAIEADARLRSLWPPDRLPQGIRFVEDVTPFQLTKVRILNGAHTALYPLACLAGISTVAEAMNDKVLGPFVEHLVMDEIISALADPGPDLQESAMAASEPANEDSSDEAMDQPLSLSVLQAYAETTFERFRNPFLHHQVSALGLNNQAKIRARLLGTVHDYADRFGSAPPRLALSLAAHWIVTQDADEVSKAGPAGPRASQSAATMEEGTRRVVDPVALWLAQSAVWGEDLTNIAGLLDQVVADVQAIRQNGVETAIQTIFPI